VQPWFPHAMAPGNSHCAPTRSGTLSQRAPRIPAASRIILRSRALSSALSNILAAVTPESRSFPSAEPRARPKRCEARSRAGRAAGELPPRGGREERMKGPRPARMPGYGAGSKRLGRSEKDAEWRWFHAPQAPGNSHCAPTLAGRFFVREILVASSASDGRRLLWRVQHLAHLAGERLGRKGLL